MKIRKKNWKIEKLITKRLILLFCTEMKLEKTSRRKNNNFVSYLAENLRKLKPLFETITDCSVSFFLERSNGMARRKYINISLVGSLLVMEAEGVSCMTMEITYH